MRDDKESAKRECFTGLHQRIISKRFITETEYEGSFDVIHLVDSVPIDYEGLERCEYRRAPVSATYPYSEFEKFMATIYDQMVLNFEDAWIAFSETQLRGQLGL